MFQLNFSKDDRKAVDWRAAEKRRIRYIQHYYVDPRKTCQFTWPHDRPCVPHNITLGEE